MNLHPVFVHFPVALLTVYSVLEILRLKKFTEQSFWFYLKASLAIFGTIGAFFSYISGEAAEHSVRTGEFVPAVENFRQVVSMHELFAKLSMGIFGLIALSYFVLWIKRAGYCHSHKIFQKICLFASFLVESPFGVIIAILGLVCITITGGLGGVMVYGTEADPFFGFVYKILIGQ